MPAKRPRKTKPTTARSGRPREKRTSEVRAKLAGHYERQREAVQRHNEEARQAARNIGEVPPCVNPVRKESCRNSFRRFCETYFAAAFCRPWSDAHLQALRTIEAVVTGGGTFAVAMPRGSGKTALAKASVLWAVLYGRHEYVAIIGPEARYAEQAIADIRTVLESSQLLADDFPEVCYPIQCLKGTHKKLLWGPDNEPIHMALKSLRIQLPNVPPSECNEAVIEATGLTGQIRGMHYARRDGSIVRPSFLFIDDPQTEESAASPSQSKFRERVVNGSILGLAGPGRKVSAMLAGTVMRPDDMVARLVDRERNPQWCGSCVSMITRWPANKGAWDKYLEFRREAWRKHGGRAKVSAACNEYYVANREALDKGASVYWEHRYDDDEVSALQHAMNFVGDRGEETFYCEYQNQPKDDDHRSAFAAERATILSRRVFRERGVIPVDCVHLSAFIDVHRENSVLFWVVLASGDDYTAHVVDYGTHPKQRVRHFTTRRLGATLAMEYPRAGPTGAIRAGIDALSTELLEREFRREDGTVVRVDRLLVDSGHETALVNEACRTSPYRERVFPSRGFGVTAVQRSLLDYTRKPGERHGWHWIIRRTADGAGRYVQFDANHWKTFVHARFMTQPGDAGAWTLFDDDHDLLADHLGAEQPREVASAGRKVVQWLERPNHPDNHWFDCLVGCAVGASILGAALRGVPRAEAKKPLRKYNASAMFRVM